MSDPILAIVGGVEAVRGAFDKLQEARVRQLRLYMKKAAGRDDGTLDEVIRKVLAAPDSRKILMPLVRECLLGTEDYSLAAMAALAVSRQSEHSQERARIMRSLAGLTDFDSVIFLLLLSSRGDMRIAPGNTPVPAWAFDAYELVAGSLWREGGTLIGSIDGGDIIAAVAEFQRRRLLYRDPLESMRLGSETTASRVLFSAAPQTPELYGLLHDGVRMVDSVLLRALSVVPPGDLAGTWSVEQDSWQPPSRSE